MPVRLATIRPLSHVEMKMVAVEGVGIRPEHDSEAPAGGGVDVAKEAAHVLVAAVPAGQDRDPAPVGEDERADVDGIGPAMLAEAGAGAAVDRAAAVGAEALDPDDPAAEPGVRRRLHRLAGPARELARERTGHRSEIGDGGADVEQLDGADRRTAVTEGAVREALEADALDA